jgi:hypothetical protein
MITFKQFITEGGLGTGTFSRTATKLEDILTFIENECSDYLRSWGHNGHPLIFRGEDFVRDLATIGDSNNFRRNSANTNSWYNQFIDNSPAWSKYPKRLSSYICANDHETAEGYGTVLTVFPINKALIGICPRDDMFTSFPEIEEIANVADYGIGDFQSTVSAILHHIDPDAVIPADDSALINFFKSITIEKILDSADDIKTRGAWYHFTILNFTKYMIKYKLASLADLYHHIFIPKDFKSSSPGQLPAMSDSHELWVSGKCGFMDVAEIMNSTVENREIMDAFAKKHDVKWSY